MTETRYAAISGIVIADAAPTALKDAASGYNKNTLWFYSTTGGLYLSVSDAQGAADWRQIITATVAPNAIAAFQNNSTTTDPGATDDSDAGYAEGSLWVNTTDNGAFVCADATATAAVWREVTFVA